MHLIYRNAIGTWEAHMNLYRHIFIKKKKKNRKKEKAKTRSLDILFPKYTYFFLIIQVIYAH